MFHFLAALDDGLIEFFLVKILFLDKSCGFVINIVVSYLSG